MAEAELSTLDTDQLVERIAHNLSVVNDTVQELGVVADVLVNRDELARLMWEIRETRGRLSDVYGQAERALLSEAGEKSFDVAGIGRVEVRVKKNRTGWKHDELVPALVKKANEERQLNAVTGELEPEGVTVARVLRDCVSFGAGKVTGLRRRGFTPDEWCQETDGGWTVQLPPKDTP